MAPQDNPSQIGSDFVKTIRHDTYPAVDPRQWNLNGIVVLVTGASRGIGRAIALSYSRAGASGIVIAGRSSIDLDDSEAHIYTVAREAGRTEPKVLKLIVDVTDSDNVAAAAKSVEESFGRLDIVVNNAGYMESWALIADSDPEDWWRALKVNLLGPYLVTRAFLPLLLKSEGGLKVILNVASEGGLRTDPGVSAYQTSKLALLRFTEFIEAENSDKGIIATVVHPGLIQTAMVDKIPKYVVFEVFETPALVGNTVVWLTKERREWLNGRYVNVTWDVEELEAKKPEIVDGDKLKVRLAV